MAAMTRAEPPPDLIARAQGGDERAFADLVSPYRAALFTLLVNELRDRSDAEDVMQEILFQLWRGLPRYEHRDRFGGWLFTIAYRALATHRRTRRREVPMPSAMLEASSGATPLAVLEAVDLQQRLLAAIAALPERQRDVFCLRHTSDVTFAEIATALGEPLN